jgi:hypothetical protein
MEKVKWSRARSLATAFTAAKLVRSGVVVAVASIGLAAGTLAPAAANAATAAAPTPSVTVKDLPGGYRVVEGGTQARIPVAMAIADGVKGAYAASAHEACYTAHNYVRVRSALLPLGLAAYDRYWNWCTNLSTSKMIGTPSVRNTHSESFGWTFVSAEIQDHWYDQGSVGYYYVGFVDIHWAFIFRGLPFSHSSTLTDNIYSYGLDVRKHT